jgi:hypothetical protein
MPCFGRGKQSVRLYAGHISAGHSPTPQQIRKEHFMKKIKDKAFAFRISEHDLNQIRVKAKRAHRTVTNYIIDSALGKEIIVIDDIEQLTKELKGIGRNLNQLTTLANMGRLQVLQLDGVRESFADIWSALATLTEEVK